MFKDIYKNKKILITGNTGFKGSWLTTWLLQMGAEVIGYSIDIPTQPSMYEVLNLKNNIKHIFGDVCDLEKLSKLIKLERPDFIFHLAAQAIVSDSYKFPIDTVTTNIIGTANILESVRDIDFTCIVILVTSDKAYENVEWVWGYRETDQLGGKDIYSGSKGAAELVIKAYLNSFFASKNSKVQVGIGRAGNVIGGGDWAKDRIVVDCMKAWSENKVVEIRSPSATRPWQHVLEPLSGYLTLGASLYASEALHGNAFNFGPRAEQNRTVIDLLSDLGIVWGLSKSEDIYQITENIPFHEAGLLKLNCDKALFHLKWEPNLDYSETIRMVGDWYRSYYRNEADMNKLTSEQISAYEDLAATRGRIWTI